MRSETETDTHMTLIDLSLFRLFFNQKSSENGNENGNGNGNGNRNEDENENENEMKMRIKWNENANENVNKMKCYQIVLNIVLNQSNKDCIDYKVHKIL